jgi:hypothetical protein
MPNACSVSRRSLLSTSLAAATLLCIGPAGAGTVPGWRVSGETSHGSGGAWRLENGVIVGRQDRPGNGGILLTDAEYADVEVALEARLDWGVDSGLFLRSSAAGAAYQVTLDHLPNGTLGGIYGEALPGGLFIRPTATPWRSEAWNAVRARITGAPPRLVVWINGTLVNDFQDAETRRARGHVALQVHGGGDTTALAARFRSIHIESL